MTWLGTYLRGMLVGAADLVPGVSGATMALLTGIYGRILAVLYACDKSMLQMLLQGQLRACFARLQGTFVLPLLLGMLSSLLLLSKVVHVLLNSYPVPFWAFFMGLVLATIGWMWKHVPLLRQPTLWLWLGLGLGISASTWLLPLRQGLVEPNLFLLFLSGMVAVSAMLLPGISGSFVLVLLGQYELIIVALNTFQLKRLCFFAIGALLGLLAFGKLVRWLWHHYPRPVLAGLTGLMLGAAPRVWPWQIEQKLVWPMVYAEQLGTSAQLFGGLLAASVGAALVWVLAPKSLFYV